MCNYCILCAPVRSITNNGESVLKMMGSLLFNVSLLLFFFFLLWSRWYLKRKGRDMFLKSWKENVCAHSDVVWGSLFCVVCHCINCSVFNKRTELSLTLINIQVIYSLSRGNAVNGTRFFFLFFCFFIRAIMVMLTSVVLKNSCTTSWPCPDFWLALSKLIIKTRNDLHIH